MNKTEIYRKLKEVMPQLIGFKTERLSKEIFNLLKELKTELGNKNKLEINDLVATKLFFSIENKLHTIGAHIMCAIILNSRFIVFSVNEKDTIIKINREIPSEQMPKQIYDLLQSKVYN